MTKGFAGGTPPMFPKRLKGSLDDLVSEIRPRLDTVDNMWSVLLDVARRIDNPEPEDWGLFDRAGIIRDIGALDWSTAGLTEHFARMALPVEDGLAQFLDDMPFELGDAVENALMLHDAYPGEMETLMSGELRSATRAIIGQNAQEADTLEPIILLHALECVQLAARDARRRIDTPTGISGLDKVKDRSPTTGLARGRIEADISHARDFQKIWARSLKGAGTEDFRDLDQMVPPELSRYLEDQYRKAHGDNLQVISSRLIVEGLERLPGWEKGFTDLARRTGKMRDTVESVLGIDALAQFHCVSASLAALMMSGTDNVMQIGRVLGQVAAGEIPHWPLSSRHDNDYVHALFLANRITIIRDRHTPPPKFVRYAEEQRRAGADSTAWNPPFSYDKVSAGLKHIERDRPLRDAHFDVAARKLRNNAEADPSDPVNARRLLEMRSRLWFRLQL